MAIDNICDDKKNNNNIYKNENSNKIDKRVFKPIKIVEYTDELKDEFSSAVIQPKKIDENYKYLDKSLWWKLKRFFWYRIIAQPIAITYCKLKLGYKFCNRKAVKSIGKEGCFLFANHTQETADAFLPTFAMFPKGVYVIVHPNNVSMPYLGRITPMLGAIPLPDNLKAAKNFLNAVEKRILEGNCVAVYPEAHIWPYCSTIRPFLAASFRYPVKFDAPSFCMTTVYFKPKRGLKPKTIEYIDGPFYPDNSLPLKEREQALRDIIYKTMCERSKLGNYEYIKYVKKESAD